MSRAPRSLTSTLDLIRWIGLAQRKAAEDWNKERDLSREQGFALAFLEQNPGSPQRDVAEATRTSAASVSSLLQGLERRGLIERRAESGDSRVKRVYLTAAGEDVITGFEAAVAALNENILAPLDSDERATLNALLTKITAELPQPTRS